MNIYTDPYSKLKSINKSIVNKALTSASGVGGALIPQHLEQVVTNAVPRLSVELAVMTPKYDPQSLHEFNQLTALNAIGSAMGESSTTPTTQPTFTISTQMQECMWSVFQ